MNGTSRKTRNALNRFAGFPLHSAALLLAGAGLLAGCSDPGPAEEAAESTDEAVEEVEEDLRGWVEDLREEPGVADEMSPEEDPERNMD